MLFLREALLFGLTQILGIFLAYRISQTADLAPVPQAQFGRQDFIALVIFVVILVLFFKLVPKRRGAMYRILFLIALIAGIQAVLSLWLEVILSTVFAVLLTYLVFKAKRVYLHNAALVLALAGIGGTFGSSLTPFSAVIILVLFSFYDIIAVYKTRHMVKMAQQMIGAGAIFGIVLPQDLGGWNASMKKVVPGKGFMILGSGDLALPLVLSAAVAKTYLPAAFIVAGFSLLGLFITHLLFTTQKERQPMAALPPIATAAIVGYLVTTLL